ncbi:MAG: hypothetical protein U0326_05425 [Polyangiales bacterium]
MRPGTPLLKASDSAPKAVFIVPMKMFVISLRRSAVRSSPSGPNMWAARHFALSSLAPTATRSSSSA